MAQGLNDRRVFSPNVDLRVRMSSRQRQNVWRAMNYIDNMAMWYGVMNEQAAEMRRIEVEEGAS